MRIVPSCRSAVPVATAALETRPSLYADSTPAPSVLTRPAKVRGLTQGRLRNPSIGASWAAEAEALKTTFPRLPCSYVVEGLSDEGE